MGIQLLTAFAVLVLGSAVFVRNEIQTFQYNMIKSLSSTALLIGENTASTLVFLDEQAAEQVLISLQVEPHIANACIYDAEGQIFAMYNRSGNENFAFPTALETHPVFRDDFLELSRIITRNQDQIGTVFLRADLSQRKEIINEYIENAIGVLVIGMVLSVILALLLQRTISRPIIDLVTVARTVSDTSDYSQRVKPGSEDELGRLSRAFNEMLDLIQKRDASLLEARDTLEQRVQDRTLELEMAKVQLERALEAEQTERTAAEDARKIAETANSTKSLFLANISHEIRTPMNAILGYAQIMDSAKDLPQNHQRAVETIKESGQHLLALINNVLDISKIEAGREELHTYDFDLRDLIRGLATMFAMRCQDKDLIWQLEERLTTQYGSVKGKTQ